MDGPVDYRLALIVARVEQVTEDVEELGTQLDRGEGRPYAHELTPPQVERLANAMSRLGLVVLAVLHRDLHRTAEREGSTHT